MNRTARDIILLMLLSVIVSAMVVTIIHLRGESAKCLASPVQYWLQRANKETGENLICTITGGKFEPLVISATNITRPEPIFRTGVIPNFTFNYSFQKTP